MNKLTIDLIVLPPLKGFFFLNKYKSNIDLYYNICNRIIFIETLIPAGNSTNQEYVFVILMNCICLFFKCLYFYEY